MIPKLFIKFYVYVIIMVLATLVLVQDIQSEPITVVFAVDHSGSMMSSDPDFITPAAVTNALNSINNLSPNSLVGYLGFASGVCDGTSSMDKVSNGAGVRFANKVSELNNTLVDPVPVGANLPLLLSKTDYSETNFFFDCGNNMTSGTHYYEPFEAALAMLARVKVNAPINTELIIFVTDGQPTMGNPGDEEDIASFDSLLVAVMNGGEFPVTYSAFFGLGYAKLEDLANASGGANESLNDADQLEGMLNNIINQNLPIVISKDPTSFYPNQKITEKSGKFPYVINGVDAWDVRGKILTE